MAINLDISVDNGLKKGSQTPRYSHHPTYFTTAADDAIDLAAVAGSRGAHHVHALALERKNVGL